MVTISQHGCSDKSQSNLTHITNSLKDGEIINIMTSLPSDDIIIPYQVDVTFLFHMPSYLRSSDLLEKAVLSIPVLNGVVDLMYFMHLESQFVKTAQRCSPSSRNIIHQLAIERPISNNLMEGEVNLAKLVQEACTMEVCVCLGDQRGTPYKG